MSFRRAIRRRVRSRRCLSGFMSPATCPCGCMGCMLLMRFRWWCAPEGCFRPLGLRRGARWLIRRPGIRPLCARALTANHYDRQSPCDPDFLRKLAKDTDAHELMRWFNTDWVRMFRRHRRFDREGVFIGDASYLFVPDNPRYEDSVKLLFGEDGHPLSQEQYRKLSDDQKSRCQWRRCYKMVTFLSHQRGLGFFSFCGRAGVAGQ